VDSVAVVRDCAGYSGGGMKKGASSSAWRVKRLHGGHVEQAWQQWHAAPAAEGSWHGRNSSGSARCRAARGRETPEMSETDWVGNVALGRAQFGAQYCFAIIQTLLIFQNTK
jgi:hypothetical protein